MKRLLRVLGAGVSGVALAMCFVPFDQAWLVWGWLWLLLPLLWTVPEKWRRLRGFGLGWIAGMAFWLINLKWLGTVTGPGVVALSVYLSLYFGIFGIFAAGAGNPWRREYRVTRTIRDRLRESTRSLGYAAVLAGLWCGLEWLRGWVMTGFGWNGLGVAFAKNLVLAQNAEFVGVIGLSFLPVFMSVVVVQTARRFYRQFQSNEVKMLHWDFASALVVIMLSFTAGTLRLSSATNTPKIEGRVLLVQQDIPQIAAQPTWEDERVVNGFFELTGAGLDAANEAVARALVEAAGAGEEEVFDEIRTPDLVVWPETCLPSGHFSFWMREDAGSQGGPLLESYLEQVVAMGDFDFILGANEVRELGEDELEFYNSMVIEAKGRERTSSQKRHLVILGEYIPDLPFLLDLYKDATGAEQFTNLSAGESDEPLQVELDGREVGVIPSICFEDTVGRLTRRSVREGAQMIVNITNDGWFQESEGAAQHYRNALFRCIELRRPMVRCANRGVTGVVSVTGSLVDPFTGEKRHLVDENGSHFHRGYLLASVYVPAEGQITLYARYGDWFAVTGLVAALVWGLASLIAGWRKKGRATT